ATLCCALALSMVACLVGGNAEQPGLELALALKRADVFDDGEENFLANLLRVFPGEIGSELENEASRRGVVPIKQLIPGTRLAAPAARQQLSFRFAAHRSAV